MRKNISVWVNIGIVSILLLSGSGLSAQTRGFPFQIFIAPEERTSVQDNWKGFRQEYQEKDSNSLLLILPDSAALSLTATALLQHFRAQSFLSVSIDSLFITTSGGSANLHLGPPMRWLRLRPGVETDAAWLQAAGFREKLFTDKPLRYDALLSLEQKLLVQAENTGFPFATIRLDSIDIGADGAVSAVLQVKRDRFITYKALKIKGDIKLPAAYLPNYLGLKVGSPYSRAQVLRLREQLSTLPFIEIAGNPTVTFTGNEATVNLFLQKKTRRAFRFHHRHFAATE